MGMKIKEHELRDLYLSKGMSVRAISERLGCSQGKINYWIKSYGINKRSISDAIYLQQNPDGDPFKFEMPTSLKETFLFGLGQGLYWGEGNKKNKTAVRLGNTDPHLVRWFVDFLIRIYHVPRAKFRFGLQVFSDMSPNAALNFWVTTLGFPRSHFGKVIITPARSIGTYREKTKHGVLTVYVSNKKLRDLLCSEIEKMKEMTYASSVR